MTLPSYHPCPPHPSFHVPVRDLLGAAPHPQGLALVGREASWSSVTCSEHLEECFSASVSLSVPPGFFEDSVVSLNPYIFALPRKALGVTGTRER